MLNHLKKIFFLFITLIIVFFSSEKSFAQQKKFKVVIDAGHGGHDTGTRGTGKMRKSEKDIALAVAKSVAKKLKAYKDIQPILTRNKDVFLELYQRAEIANKHKADLFISIHCNANKNSRASGSETFVLGVHRNKDNLEVAKRENAVIELEADNKLHYKGFDPKHPETFIGLTLMQEEFLDQSIMLASYIQEQYKKYIKNSKDRSVQQAGFAVLRLTYMPSVLTEIGFLTNPKQEKFLHSKAGQDKIATAIVKAIIKYKKYINYDTPEPEIGTTTGNQTIVSTNPSKEQIAEKEVVESDVDKKISKQSDKSQNTQQKSNSQVRTEYNVKDAVFENVIFKVQLLATSKKIPLTPENFRGLKDLSRIKEGDMYKYFAGHTSDFEKILEVKGEARYKSFKQAFIVAYVNGKRVPLSQVLKNN